MTSPESMVERSLQVLKGREKTYTVAIATSRKKGMNVLHRIPCHGQMIGGYVLQIAADSRTDSYHVECVDFIHLGVVPVSFVARATGSPYWEVRVPAPEAVVRKFMTPTQKEELKKFRENFKKPDYSVRLLQMIAD